MGDVEQVYEALYQDGDERHVACYGEYRLGSAYQPIYEATAAGLTVAGHEALLRPSRDGSPVAPTDFLVAVPPEDVVLVERICRVLHLRNFVASPAAGGRIYLNVNPAAYTDARRCAQMTEGLAGRLHSLGVAPSQIVFEIVETEHDDVDLLGEVVEQLRAMGGTIAIDDFGARHSNFDRLFDLGPDLVKFDRQWLARCRDDAGARRLFAGVVHLIREMGIEVSCEGIETEAELSLAIDSGASLLQGYHLGRPAGRPVTSPPAAIPHA